MCSSSIENDSGTTNLAFLFCGLRMPDLVNSVIEPAGKSYLFESIPIFMKTGILKIFENNIKVTHGFLKFLILFTISFKLEEVRESVICLLNKRKPNRKNYGLKFQFLVVITPMVAKTMFLEN